MGNFEEYPLMKNYDFGEVIQYRFGGNGTLLIPNKKSFSRVKFSFKDLALLNYLQNPFNKNKSVRISELIKKLSKEKNNKILLSYFIKERDSIYKIINKYEKYKILKNNSEIGKEISKDENWEETKVENLEYISRQEYGFEHNLMY